MSNTVCFITCRGTPGTMSPESTEAPLISKVEQRSPTARPFVAQTPTVPQPSTSQTSTIPPTASPSHMELSPEPMSQSPAMKRNILQLNMESNSVLLPHCEQALEESTNVISGSLVVSLPFSDPLDVLWRGPGSDASPILTPRGRNGWLCNMPPLISTNRSAPSLNLEVNSKTRLVSSKLRASWICLPVLHPLCKFCWDQLRHVKDLDPPSAALEGAPQGLRSPAAEPPEV